MPPAAADAAHWARLVSSGGGSGSGDGDRQRDPARLTLGYTEDFHSSWG